MRSSLTLVLFIINISISHLFAQDIRILAIDIYGNNNITKQWSSTINYLNNKIPKHSFSVISIKPNKTDKMKQLILNKKVDFIITQPAIYIDLELSSGISRILTLAKQKNICRLGSVIFSKKGSGIKNISQIADKKIGAVAKLGFGGWLIAYNELLENNIDLYKTSKSLTFLGTQNNVIDAVLNNRVDVGIIRTGLIEKMVQKNKIKLSDINIINQKHHKEFTNISSSKLYPEWAFAKTPHISSKIAKQIQLAGAQVE